MKTQQQGSIGEALAREFLESNGYRFIEANFVRRVGEIDLIMSAPHSEGNTIVFIEVRYRSDNRYGGALASVTWQKQRKLVRAANAWLQKCASSRDCARIDVIAIERLTKPPKQDNRVWKQHQLTWIQNAVECPT